MRLKHLNRLYNSDCSEQPVLNTYKVWRAELTIVQDVRLLVEYLTDVTIITLLGVNVA
ncbi:hypothetical protein ACSF83_08025 [Lactobacillus johnsonii]|uniref:hypothetical protein n=1 Tax=Lactobacillus johnsonii TaxID=33959 RepID=UPI00290823D7|nr:hypothetical protein [Lactobacillus johnsonii]